MGKAQDSFWLLTHGSKESSYGAGISPGSMDRWYSTETPVLVSNGGEEQTDENEIKGYTGISAGGAAIIRKESSGSIEFKTNLELMGHILASLNSNVGTTGNAPNYVHLIKEPAPGVESPRTFSIVQGQDRNALASCDHFKGLWVDGFDMDVQQGGNVMTKLDIQGDGSQEAASGQFSLPAVGTALKGERVRFEHVTCFLGPNGTEDVSSLFRSMKVGQKAGVTKEPRAARGTLVGAIYYGDGQPTITCELVLKGQQGDVNYNYWKNRTAIKLDLKVQINANRYIRLQGNSVEIPWDTKGITGWENGVVPVLKLPLRFHFVQADSSKYIWTVANSVPSYLQ